MLRCYQGISETSGFFLRKVESDTRTGGLVILSKGPEKIEESTGFRVQGPTLNL